MNENLNLVEILKYCPEGTKLYSPVYADVEFLKIHHDENLPIEVKLQCNTFDCFSTDGRIFTEFNGECILFPSREQRDWSKFNPNK